MNVRRVARGIVPVWTRQIAHVGLAALLVITGTACSSEPPKKKVTYHVTGGTTKSKVIFGYTASSGQTGTDTKLGEIDWTKDVTAAGGTVQLEAISDRGLQDLEIMLECSIAVDGKVLIRTSGSPGCKAKLNLDEPPPGQPSA
ncbi:hypothetical protein [Dactylosporangium sp. NPDC050588]|uniref:hypothetical protein n=1 Tax=Dactylosporangium sp. NPDC050588 TaxID=3157211 RepID=UPI0033ED244B